MKRKEEKQPIPRAEVMFYLEVMREQILKNRNAISGILHYQDRVFDFNKQNRRGRCAC